MAYQIRAVLSSGSTQTCAEAIAAYVDTNEWQLSEIQAALTEAHAQDYATDQDMADRSLSDAALRDWVKTHPVA